MDLIRAEKEEHNIIYINKEDIAYVEIDSYRALHDCISVRLSHDKRNYIFIDEIQEITPISELSSVLWPWMRTMTFT